MGGGSALWGILGTLLGAPASLPQLLGKDPRPPQFQASRLH